MSSTKVLQRVNAPRAAVYRFILDARAVAQWMVPDGMTSEIHRFEPREGGSFRISLTYESPDARGKTSAHTDSYHGRFVTLVPDERIVETIEFETDDPAMQGEMTVTITLRDVDGGTEVRAVHEPLPPALSPRDNETGWRMSLAKLAALVESESSTA
ncbi:MAG: SRPBCC family protein [Thermoanaerobaculia bacterium]